MLQEFALFGITCSQTYTCSLVFGLMKYNLQHGASVQSCKLI